MDLIRDYALPIPTTIISEMLGVPVSDRHKFHRWSQVIVASGSLRLEHAESHSERDGVSSLHPKARQGAKGEPSG